MLPTMLIGFLVFLLFFLIVLYERARSRELKMRLAQITRIQNETDPSAAVEALRQEVTGIDVAIKELRRRMASLTEDLAPQLERLVELQQKVEADLGYSVQNQGQLGQQAKETFQQLAQQMAQLRGLEGMSRADLIYLQEQLAAQKQDLDSARAAMERIPVLLGEEQRRWTGELELLVQKQLAEELPERLDARFQDFEQAIQRHMLLSQDNRLAVAIDFENYFIQLASSGLKIDPMDAFVRYLTNPDVADGRERLWLIKSLVVYTNGSRWKSYRKQWNRGKHEPEILRREAENHLDQLIHNGFRVVQTEANVDVQLAFEILEMVERGRIDRLVLVANDNTYTALVAMLVKRGVFVTGINVSGGMGGDLRGIYKDCGLKRMDLNTNDARCQEFLKKVEKKGDPKTRKDQPEKIAQAKEASPGPPAPVEQKTDSAPPKPK